MINGSGLLIKWMVDSWGFTGTLGRGRGQARGEWIPAFAGTGGRSMKLCEVKGGRVVRTERRKWLLAGRPRVFEEIGHRNEGAKAAGSVERRAGRKEGC